MNTLYDYEADNSNEGGRVPLNLAGSGDVNFHHLVAVMSILWGILIGLISQNLTPLPGWVAYSLYPPLALVLSVVAGRITFTPGGFWRLAGGMSFLAVGSAILVTVVVVFLQLLGT